MALVDQSGRKKPAFYAMKTFVKKLDGFTQVSATTAGELYINSFTVNGKLVEVVWANSPQALRVQTNAQRVMTTNAFGNVTREWIPQNGTAEIPVDRAPVFVEFEA